MKTTGIIPFIGAALLVASACTSNPADTDSTTEEGGRGTDSEPDPGTDTDDDPGDDDPTINPPPTEPPPDDGQTVVICENGKTKTISI